MGTCQLLALKEISVQEEREDCLEMKIREWKNITYLPLFNVSSEGDNELACTQLYNTANSPTGVLPSGCKHIPSLLIFTNDRNF